MLAATMALTTLAVAPARAASDDQIARAIAGAIAFLVIGNAVASASGNKTKKPVTASGAATRNAPIYNRDYNRDTWRAPQYDRPKSKYSSQPRRRALPSACLFRVAHGKQRVAVYGSTCLKEFAGKSLRLPKTCARVMPVRISARKTRKATVYDAACLREHGYRPVRMGRR